MGIFTIAHGIVTSAVRSADINLRELQASAEGQSAWYLYDRACKIAQDNLRISEGEAMGQKGEKVTRRALSLFQSLAVDGWKDGAREGEAKDRAYRTYANRQEAALAADVLALCSQPVQREDELRLSMPIAAKALWCKIEAQGPGRV